MEENRQVPFNMALNTLESIRNWLDDIAKLSIGIVGGERLDLNEMITIKKRMVKQLIMLTTPLLEKDDLKDIQEFFSSIEIEKGRLKVDGGWRKNVEVYTTKIDYKLDECVMGIETALQDYGHFMPGPDESALF